MGAGAAPAASSHMPWSVKSHVGQAGGWAALAMPVLGVNITFGCTVGIKIFVMWGVCARDIEDLSLVSLARTHFHLDGEI